MGWGQQGSTGDGDWLYDEIRLSQRGYVLHEIEWSCGSRWLIECGDVSYRLSRLDTVSADADFRAEQEKDCDSY